MATGRPKLAVGDTAQTDLFSAGPLSLRKSSGVTIPASIASGDSAETAYLRVSDPLHRKLHAQFFTPAVIADLMVKMAAPSEAMTVLDPACGTGALVAALRRVHCSLQITALDIDTEVLAYLRADAMRSEGVELLQADYLSWPDDRQFDRVIANPPYLKYQHFDCPDSIYSRLELKFGLNLSRLSNLYLLFILESYRRLKIGGRLVFIVPGEWTNANFGMAFKVFLAKEGCLSRLIYFSHLSEQFDDALTTASILELTKTESGQRTFQCFYVKPDVEIASISLALSSGQSTGNVSVTVFDIDALAAEKKWDSLLDSVFSGASAAAGLVPLKNWCFSRRGIATGANEFFHLQPSRAAKLGLEAANLLECVGGARHVKGLIFARQDFEALRASDHPCLLWSLRRSPSTAELQYVSQGELQCLHDRYLLSKRKPWYSMERANVAPIWIGVFSRGGLRAVRNLAGVAHLTTFHGLTPISGSPILADALTVILNSRYAKQAIQRARRVFGAGLEKVEPADLLDFVLPDLSIAQESALQQLAALLPRMDFVARKSAGISEGLAAIVDAEIIALWDGLSVQDQAQRIPIEDEFPA